MSRAATVDYETWFRAVYPVHGAKWIAEETSQTVSAVRNYAYRRGIQVDQQSTEWRSHRKPQPRGYKRPNHSAVMKQMAADGRVGFRRLPPERFAEIHAKGIASARKNGHPRGMLGKTHTREVRARISAAQKRMVADGTHVALRPKTAAQRKARSLLSQKQMRERPSSVYSHAKRGHREDLGDIFFRSRWEANYARYLEWRREKGLLAKWEFEAETFWFEKIRRGVRSYTPDFRITENNGAVYFVEVKGWMDKKSATKLKRMKKYYPDVDLRLFDAKAYRELSKYAPSFIPKWEAE